jgi:hypothetical protein
MVKFKISLIFAVLAAAYTIYTIATGHSLLNFFKITL